MQGMMNTGKPDSAQCRADRSKRNQISMNKTTPSFSHRRPPLVLLHGLGQRADSWKPVIRHLSAQTPVIAADLGEYMTDQEASFERLAALLERSLETLQEPADIAGLSLGAVLALDYALSHPDKTRSLILIAPQYKMPKGLLRVQNAVFTVLPERMFSGTGLLKTQMKSLTSSMMQLDYTEKLKNLVCPVLVVVGSKDRANRKAAQKLTALLPQARLVVMEGSGHEVNRDDPARLAGMMRRFLGELSRM